MVRIIRSPLQLRRNTRRKLNQNEGQRAKSNEHQGTSDQWHVEHATDQTQLDSDAEIIAQKPRTRSKGSTKATPDILQAMEKMMERQFQKHNEEVVKKQEETAKEQSCRIDRLEDAMNKIQVGNGNLGCGGSNQSKSDQNHGTTVEAKLCGSNHNCSPINSEFLLQRIAEASEGARVASECTQFAQIQATLQKLTGTEGRTRLKAYFAGFEAITNGWSSGQRAVLLSTKVVGQARITFDGLTEEEQSNYVQIKSAMMNGNSSIESLRIAAQKKLMDGITPRPNEDLREYGMRLLGAVRDANLPITPEETVQETACAYFLRSIKDRIISSSLTLMRGTVSYHELIDKAAILSENSSWTSKNWNGKNVNNDREVQDLGGSKPDDHQKQENFNHNGGRNSWRPMYNPPFKKTGGNSQPLGNNRENGRGNVLQSHDDCTLPPEVYQSIRDSINEEGHISAMIAAMPGAQKTIFGAPTGRTLTTYVEIHGTKVLSLLDSGANMNTITRHCLANIASRAKLQLEKMYMHPPYHDKSKIADTGSMQFVAGVSLPVSRPGLDPVWVEFHVPKASQPFPIIIGTAALGSLGFKMIDMTTTMDILTSTKYALSQEQNAIIASVFADATIKPFAEGWVKVKSENLPDGDYVFTNSVEPGSDAVVSVKDEKFDIPLRNTGILKIECPKGMVLGDLTPVEKSLVGEEILSQTTDPFIANAIVDDRTKTLLQKINISERSAEEIREIEALLDEYNDVFALSDEELGQTPAVQHKIELSDSKPIRVARRPIPFALREQVAKMVDDYLQRGVIQPSSSPYSSPVTIVKKKDGSLRFCVDYRRLNAITKKDAYPVPDIDSMLLSLGKRKYFSSLDLLSGYWQVKMDPASTEKTAFPTEQGLFEFTVMPFGLTNAPATFERLMECIMRGYIGNFVYVYLDDVLVASESWTDHIDHLRKVFQRLRDNRLKLKPSKCKILAEQIEFLGHKLTGDGLKMNEEKLKAIKEFPTPQNVRELQRFLGLAGYYRKFIRGFAMIAKPLHNLCGKTAWEWSEESHNAFETLIVKICEDVTLKLPDFQAARDNPDRPFVIQTDASKLGLAGILSQKDEEGRLRPIYFVSRLCQGAEARYAATELEALALRFAVRKFGPYIIGMKAIVETDHSALVQMFTNPKDCGSSRINKWAMEISSKFNLEIRHKAGKSNAAADALSRNIAITNLLLSTQAEIPLGGKISREEWIANQESCEFGDVLKYISDRELPLEVMKIQKVLGNLGQFSVIDGCLYFTDPQNNEPRLVVPEKYRKEIFHEAHAGPIGSHACGQRIYDQLRRKFFWTNMRADCVKWSLNCPICAFCREPRKNTPPLQPIVVTRPLELVCLDILQLGLTPDGNKYALVIIDHFTKYLIAVPLRTKSAEEVARAFVERVLLIYGAPVKIHSDKGREFTNSTVEHICKVMNIEQSTTAGYNPRAVGIVERANREIIMMLRKKCVVPAEWDMRLPFITFAYNTSVHTSTKETPYFCMFGHDPNLPSIVDPSLYPYQYLGIDEYKAVVAENTKNMIEHVKHELEKARQEFKKHYDKNKKVIAAKYKLGERVMLYDPRVKNKLDWHYQGPFRIVDLEGSNAKIRLADRPNGKCDWVPIDRLCAIPEGCELPQGGGKARERMVGHINCILTPSYYDNSSSLNHLSTILANKTMTQVISSEIMNASDHIYNYTTTKKDLMVINYFQSLGLLHSCQGDDHQQCTPITVGDIINTADLSSTVKQSKVRTLAQQLALRSIKDSSNIGKINDLLVSINSEKGLNIMIKEISMENLIAECHRRATKCLQVSGKLSASRCIPLRSIGRVRHLMDTVIKGSVIAHERENRLDTAWETVRFRLEQNFNEHLLTDTMLLLVPDEIESLGEPTIDDSRTIRFADLSQLITKLKGLRMAGTVQSSVVFLPALVQDYLIGFNELQQLMGAIKHVTWNVILPPAVKSPLYDTVIAQLCTIPDANIIADHCFKKRNLFSLGWTGDSINNFHVKEGKWTRHGIHSIRQFLECLKIPLPVKSAGEPVEQAAKRNSLPGAVQQHPSDGRNPTAMVRKRPYSGKDSGELKKIRPMSSDQRQALNQTPISHRSICSVVQVPHITNRPSSSSWGETSSRSHRWVEPNRPRPSISRSSDGSARNYNSRR